ncbi:LDH2 family malate/lactate/ureidoglycolate dehydrogenase [Robbsia andropogonis]
MNILKRNPRFPHAANADTDASGGGQPHPDTIALTLEAVLALAEKVLTLNGMSEDQAAAMARTLTAGQRDDCQSHGLYRLFACVHTLRHGAVRGHAMPVVEDATPALVRVDADFGFSTLAFERGLPLLIEKARRTGIAAMAIHDCYHVSALWPEVEALAVAGLAGLAMTPAHDWVAPAGGNRPVFGTNPIAFAWPRPGPLPYVFDFATSAIARGEIELHRQAGTKIPLDWAIDAQGQATDDPAAALEGAMRTFGGHKGSALATMIELLAGPLMGELTSIESAKRDGGVGAVPCHGELIVAFDPLMFSGGSREVGNAYAEAMFDRITGQGARLPSQRRFAARERAMAEGVVQISRERYDAVLKLIPSRPDGAQG